MVKFKIEKENDLIEKENNSSESDLDISININIKPSRPDKIKIGKKYYDEETKTRLAIVKLSKLGYNCMKI